jgi:hypothetical protein
MAEFVPLGGINQFFPSFVVSPSPLITKRSSTLLQATHGEVNDLKKKRKIKMLRQTDPVRPPTFETEVVS